MSFDIIPNNDQLNSHAIRYHTFVVSNILVHVYSTSVHYLSKKVYTGKNIVRNCLGAKQECVTQFN